MRPCPFAGADPVWPACLIDHPNFSEDMIRLLIALLCCATLLPAHAQADNPPFSGAWSVKWCPKDRRAECGGFYLYLVQKGDAICGTHFAATPGLGKVDEGLGPSISGKVVGSTASITIMSGRDDTVFHARAERAGRMLKWKLLDIEAGDGRDFVLAEEATLRRIEANEQLNRIRKECH